MGDFIIDFREPKHRRAITVADRFRYMPHIRIEVVQTPRFDLAVAVTENPDLWAPYVHPDGTRGVALAGRVALRDEEIETGRTLPGKGGSVCKALDALIQRLGESALTTLPGNFTIVAWSASGNRVNIISDTTGVYPLFETSVRNAPLFGSHPDALADATSAIEDLDHVSLAEFLLTGTVSPPFTYYRSISAVGMAASVVLQFGPQGEITTNRSCYQPLEFQGPGSDSEDDLAHELAAAFKGSVARRTSRMLGKCAVALSGGLDSRAVLASLHPSADAFSFTCFDSKNLEFRSAESIASASQIPLVPYLRPFDYYGNNAQEGVRIGGGMGSFANNHFLGAIPWLREQGAQTLLTGCYCDYMFKALPLNRRVHPVTGLEELAPFNTEFYFSQVWPKTTLAEQVQARIASRYPRSLTEDTSDAGIFRLETLRTFPLCYEGDNAQRVVPQRLTGWFPPVSDPELLKVYCRIPYRWKLNRSIFKRAVRIICGTKFDNIPDANTGAKVGAPWWNTALNSALLALQKRLLKRRSGLATEGSWPNWRYYTAHSRVLADLWKLPTPQAEPIIQATLGEIYPKIPFGQGTEREMWLQIQMLTLKLWLASRSQG